MASLQITSANGKATASRIALGCMNFGGHWAEKVIDQTVNFTRAREALTTALEQGITLFDHADLYKGGESERIFGELVKELKLERESLIVQSKCAVRWCGQPGEHSPIRFDTSAGHIERAVDGSLKRLKTDYLDILLIHHPDPLLNPEEVAGVFDKLHDTGKIRYFGVSNFNAHQMELLRRSISQPLAANQLNISLGHVYPVVDGNQNNGKSTMRNEGLLEHCMLHGIVPQAWSPLAAGAFSRPDPRQESAAAAQLVASFADEKGCSPEAIVIAWLLKHPSGIVPVIGTRTPDRIRNCCEATNVALSREEWYRLLQEARGKTILD